MHYAERLHRAIDEKKSPLVVGLDPRLARLPASVVAAAREEHGEDAKWITEALHTFCRGVLDAVEPFAPAVKVNIAFFEQYHIPGLIAYGRVLADARARGFIVIGDVKRSDIGSTAEAYAVGHLDSLDEAAQFGDDERLTVDAVTINPYLGSDCIQPFLERCKRLGRGIYILVKTSNPSSAELQDLWTADGRVSENTARLVTKWGALLEGIGAYDPVGAVVGATFPEELEAHRKNMPRAPFLVPGYGAQGGGAADVAPAFDAKGHGALINASRSVIFAYESPDRADVDWTTAVRDAAREAAAELDAVRHGG